MPYFRVLVKTELEIDLSTNTSVTLKNLRKQILKMAYDAQEGHVPSALSILEPIFFAYKNWDLGLNGQDSFVLSKGHGCLALYAVLNEFGLIDQADIDNFCKFGGTLGGHPDSTKVRFISASTGSLGHGFPIAAGMAYSKKYFQKCGRVLAIIGDGECNEGSIWETALLASQNKLNNLYTWIDFNHSGDRAIKLEDLGEKWKSFGFQVLNIDGHSMDDISKALNFKSEKPLAIVANSIKGHGIEFMHNNPEWHHTKIDEAVYLRAVSDLK